MNHYVYEITNLVNGKKYIGKRSCNCPIEDDKYMGSGSRLIESQNKYGIENFKKEILEICETEYDAYQKEIEIIKNTGATTFNQHKYYNLSQGGKGVKPGHDLYIKMLPTYKESAKIAAKFNTGKNSYRSRRVVLLNTGEIFDSMGEARRKHGDRVYAAQITNNCKNPEASGGYLKNGEPAKWMYYEEYLKLNENNNIKEDNKMEKQILELLLKMDDKLKEMDDKIERLVNDVKELKKDMRDRFDIVDIRSNIIENKVTRVSSKLDVITNQVDRNIETIENIKLKLQ